MLIHRHFFWPYTKTHQLSFDCIQLRNCSSTSGENSWLSQHNLNQCKMGLPCIPLSLPLNVSWDIGPNLQFNAINFGSPAEQSEPHFLFLRGRTHSGTAFCRCYGWGDMCYTGYPRFGTWMSFCRISNT